MSKEPNQKKLDKPIKPGHFEFGYDSSLECLLADIGIKLISFQF